MNEGKRGKVSEGEAKFFASPNERRKTQLRKSSVVPFFGSFFGQAKNEHKEKKPQKIIDEVSSF